MTPTVHILILAAGASSRMRGVDKLLQPVDAQPMLRHVVQAALGCGCPVTVTLPPGSPREAVLQDLPLRLVMVPDASDGMSRSLCRGIQSLSAATEADGVMVLPADMPGFTTAALARVIARFRSAPGFIVRGGTEAGQPGHPAIFPHDLWPALAAVTGDEGGRSVIKRNPARVRVILLPGTMAILDLDTPEDWAAWQAR